MVAGDRELATMATMTAMTVDKTPSKRPYNAISNEPSPRGPGGSGGADQSKSSSSTEESTWIHLVSIALTWSHLDPLGLI